MSAFGVAAAASETFGSGSEAACANSSAATGNTSVNASICEPASALDDCSVIPPESIYFYPFRKFLLAPLLVLALFGNIAILVGVARVRGISRSTRMYYALIAVAELVVAASYFFTSQFLELTIWLWFRNGEGPFFVYTAQASDAACKLISALWVAADSVAGYTIVCLGVERLIAITWPFRAKAILTPRFSAVFLAIVVGSVGTISTLITALNYGLSEVELFRPKICTYTTEHVGETLSQLFVWLESCMTAGHTVLALVISVVLLFRLHVAKLSRRRMSISVDKLSSKEVSYALILVSIAFIHCAIYAPLSGFAIWYHSTNKTRRDAEDCGYAVGFPFLILDVLTNLTLVTHSVNFFVYLSRSRHFRKALLCCRRRKWRALGDQHSATGNFSLTATSAIFSPNSVSKHVHKTKSATPKASKNSLNRLSATRTLLDTTHV